MKRILITTFCFLILSGVSIAQSTETFDIATFKPPLGWKKEVKEKVVQLSIEDGGADTYCLITLFKSIPSTGGPARASNRRGPRSLKKGSA
ncbi:MAG: hypothetical protein ABI857_13955 [Acidobacteriota bacterium]